MFCFLLLLPRAVLTNSLMQYTNYGFGDERVREIYGEHYDRLALLKAKYDPNMVFKRWFPIVPASV